MAITESDWDFKQREKYGVKLNAADEPVDYLDNKLADIIGGSLEISDGDIQLKGDEDSPGNSKLYGTSGTGEKGWYDQPGGFPSGGIIMWSGAISAIPSGWVICDGTNSTPDLTARFVIHADADSGGTYDVGDTGGATTGSITGNVGATTLSESQIPSHDHSINHTHTFFARTGTGTGFVQSSASSGTQSRIDLTHTGNSGNAGSGSSHTHSISKTVDIVPPYYALAYIMKT